MLARLRFDVRQSAGRRFPELPHPYRDDFQRDRARIVHARAFRRLENKTQVFPSGYSDHFRNRLTHTIEVTQVARTIASALGLNESLTEALALVHDIGHPPFAHAGEEQLDKIMRRYGDRFNHNLHALRIVDHFEHRYPRFPGLNLTFEVREGIVKHSQDIQPGESPELDELLPGLLPPLEAQIIDICDEIAYNTADLDDAMSAGLVDASRMCAEVPIFARFYERVEFQYPGASERVRLDEVVRGLVDWFCTGLLTATIEAAKNVQNVEELRRYPTRLAQYTPETAEASAQLKSILRREVYSSGMVAAERIVSTGQISQLFTYLMKHPEALPAGYLDDSPPVELHRAVCDYIAGMTDGYLERTCALLFHE